MSRATYLAVCRHGKYVAAGPTLAMIVGLGDGVAPGWAGSVVDERNIVLAVGGGSWGSVVP